MASVGPLLVWVVEVGQDVFGSAFERSSQRDDLREGARHARGGQRVDVGSHQGLARARVGRAVGVDDVLVGAPGDLECDVLVAGKQVE